jgi:cyanophycinase
MIKPLYLLADSQIFFWKNDSGSLARRIRADLDSSNPRAAYLGASNGDQTEFYSLFLAAMEMMEVSDCRLVPSKPSREDIMFLEKADLILLAGGDVERGWKVFEQNGFKDLIARRRYDGALLVGVSAGAVQLGLGALTNSARPKQLSMFRFAPFYIGAHDEKNDWWDLRALVNLSQTDTRAIGIAGGGGAAYYPDGTLEPIRKPLIEIVKQEGKISENLMAPLSG